MSQVLVASWKRIYIWKDPAVETAGYPYNVPNGTNMPEALDKDSQPFQGLGVTQVRMYYYSPLCGSGVFDFYGPLGLKSR